VTDVTTTESAPPSVPTEPDTKRGSRSGPAWWQVVAIVVVLCVVAGAVGWRIGQSDDSPPSATSVDVGFFYDMTAHHQQAIAMALIYLRNGNDPLLLAIAKEIVQYQSSEIGMMNEYLAQWGRDGNRPAKAMGWMQPPVARDKMPGLATNAQMQQLENARGFELDNLFTQLMIEHHAGGVHMAAYAAEHAEQAGTRKWAAQMDDGQRGEISEMNQWRRRHDLPVIVPPLAEFTPKADAYS
jgi:uncharacterized protein (DUF305 family)